MTPLNERLVAMFEHLKSTGAVTTQKSLSAAIGTTAAALNAAIKGRENISIDFLRRVDNAFGNIFSPSWIATGDGDMLRHEYGVTDINIDMSDKHNHATGNATIINGGGSDALVALQVENRMLRADVERLRADLDTARATIERLQNAIISAITPK